LDYQRGIYSGQGLELQSDAHFDAVMHAVYSGGAMSGVVQGGMVPTQVYDAQGNLHVEMRPAQ
jgi:hypothetical protein